MKTLRNTLIIVLVVTSLGFVNLFAQMKAERMKSAREMMTMDPKSEKIRVVSEQAIRDVLSGIFNNVVVEQTGKVSIIFKVSGNKKVEVQNIFGQNPELVKAVKETLTRTTILVPEALEGKYVISVLF